MSELGTTLTQHILDQQRLHPSARGEMTGLLTQIGVAAKVISARIRRAGLSDVLGPAGWTNYYGDEVQKLDHLANQILVQTLSASSNVAAMASEEEDRWIEVEGDKRGSYIVMFDPLDGASNIDANITIGTIFAIYRRGSGGYDIGPRDVLRRGREQVAAGYVIYGSATILVYSTGQGVHGFTLDPTVGEFVLSHPAIRIPDVTTYLSINQANEPYWPSWVRPFIDELLRCNDQDGRCVSGRHVGTLVADFHRNLMAGGVFLYPADSLNRVGKLRLLYELFPLAYIAEQAGGAATDGRGPLLDLVAGDLHERTTVIIGNASAVELATRFAREAEAGGQQGDGGDGASGDQATK